MNSMTVQQAITRGQFVVNVPVVLIIATGIFGTLWYAESIGASGAWAILGFLVSIPIAWLYWSLVAPKWLLWAYQNVDNQAALRYRAEQSSLIYRRGHRFERTMIMSNEARAALNLFEIGQREQNKFGLDEAEETMFIYLSHSSFWIMAILLLFFLIGSVYVLIEKVIEGAYYENETFLFIGIFLVCLYGLFRRIPLIDFPPFIPMARKYFDHESQIDILKEGISIKHERTGLIPWDKVISFNINYEKGSAETLSLIYEITEEEHKYLDVNLENYAVDGYKMEGLLNQYVN